MPAKRSAQSKASKEPALKKTVSYKPAKGKSKIASIADWERIIAVARDRAGTNVALAEILGVSESAVRNWLGGASPPADVLVLLHEKLGFSPSYLLTGEGDPFTRVSESSEEGRQRLAATVSHLRTSMDELASSCRQVLPLLDASAQADLATSLKSLSKSLDELKD